MCECVDIWAFILDRCPEGRCMLANGRCVVCHRLSIAANVCRLCDLGKRPRELDRNNRRWRNKKVREFYERVRR